MKVTVELDIDTKSLASNALEDVNIDDIIQYYCEDRDINYSSISSYIYKNIKRQIKLDMIKQLQEKLDEP